MIRDGKQHAAGEQLFNGDDFIFDETTNTFKLKNTIHETVTKSGEYTFQINRPQTEGFDLSLDDDYSKAWQIWYIFQPKIPWNGNNTLCSGTITNLIKDEVYILYCQRPLAFVFEDEDGNEKVYFLNQVVGDNKTKYHIGFEFISNANKKLKTAQTILYTVIYSKKI